jgi:hypothetical protein
MNWRAIAFIALIITGRNSVPSNAAEISCSQLYTADEKPLPKYDEKIDWGAGRIPTPYVTCFGGFLRGQISKGDYEKVATFLKAHHPFVAHFSLASPGGDVGEALKIGRLFRRYLIGTFAPVNEHFEATGIVHDDVPFLASGSRDLCRGQDCICASACALIWMGGVTRLGTVGLHRPRIDDPVYRGLMPANASTAYNRLLGEVGAYLDEMEVPKPIIESMVATSSGDILWVNYPDNDGLGIPPSIAEWEDASCGSDVNLSNTDPDTPAGREVFVKVVKHAICSRNLRAINRGRLAPP